MKNIKRAKLGESSFLFLAVGFLLLFSPCVSKAQNNSTVKCEWTWKLVLESERVPRLRYNGVTDRLETDYEIQLVYVNKRIYECVPVVVENNSATSSGSSSVDSKSSSNSGEKRQLAKTLSAKAKNLLSQADDLRTKGKILESQGKYREAIDAFSAIIGTELDTKQYIIEAYIMRASIKLGLEDYRGAIEDSSSAIQLSTPLKKNVMEILAAVESKEKSSSGDVIEKAVASATLLDELRGKNPEVRAAMDGLQMGYLLRAMAKNKLGDKNGACEDYRMLCSLGFGYDCSKPNEFCN